MPAGYTQPWVLFLGNLWPQERAYVAEVMTAARKAGYDRLIEPAAGTFAVSLMAADLGWPVEKIEASDVSLYSSALGCAIGGRDLAELGVTLDGEALTLEGNPVEQAAHLLWQHLLTRTESKHDKNPTEYMGALVVDFRDRAAEHRAEISKHVQQLADRLRGFTYFPMDCFDHVIATRDDPKALIVANPTTVTRGYEKFFDTAGRIRWAEPAYRIFDAKEGPGALVVAAEGACLALVVQECEPGKSAMPNPVFARHVARNRYNYYLANRPGEVRDLVGGVRVMPRTFSQIESLHMPVVEPGVELTSATEIEVCKITAPVAGYYKDLWHHGFESKGASQNLAVVLDGALAGIAGIDAAPIINVGTRGQATDHKYGDCILLTYNFAAPVDEWRLPRLLTMLCLSRNVIRGIAGPTASWLVLAQGAVTVAFTKLPESKPIRGLMKLVERRNEGGAYKLVYHAALNDKPAGTVFADWLAKELKWREARTSA